MQNDQPLSYSPADVLHTKQNMETELKWQTCLAQCQAKLAVRRGKG